MENSEETGGEKEDEVYNEEEYEGQEYEEEGDESQEIDPDYVFVYDDDEMIFCSICECWMSGPKMYETHVAGARHNKNIKNSKLGAPIKKKGTGLPKIHMKDGKLVSWKPKCQAAIDGFEQPLIGLQFVTEWCHYNRYVEPRYSCALCKAKCDVRMLTSHMAGLKHRLTYMKLFYPEMAAKVTEEERKPEKAPMAEKFSKQIEEHEGRQSLRVKVEGSYQGVTGDRDDAELEAFITSNKDNFQNYLMYSKGKSKNPKWLPPTLVKGCAPGVSNPLPPPPPRQLMGPESSQSRDFHSREPYDGRLSEHLSQQLKRFRRDEISPRFSPSSSNSHSWEPYDGHISQHLSQQLKRFRTDEISPRFSPSSSKSRTWEPYDGHISQHLFQQLKRFRTDEISPRFSPSSSSRFTDGYHGDEYRSRQDWPEVSPNEDVDYRFTRPHTSSQRHGFDMMAGLHDRPMTDSYYYKSLASTSFSEDGLPYGSKIPGLMDEPNPNSRRDAYQGRSNLGRARFQDGY